MTYDCHTTNKIVTAPRRATTVLNMFKTIACLSTTYADHPRFFRSHGDATTNVLRMYHDLSRFLKSWTIGTKDRDSVIEA